MCYIGLDGELIVDIGSRTTKGYKDIILEVESVFVNGPMAYLRKWKAG